MARNAIDSWNLAEIRCFDYLRGKVQAASDEAYQAESPDLLTDAQRDRSWHFEISGGSGEINNINSSDKPPSCVRMAAQIVGAFLERSDAQSFAGLLLNFLPANRTDIAEISILGFAGQPLLARGTVDLDVDDGTEGGEMQAWILTVPLYVIFDTQTAMAG